MESLVLYLGISVIGYIIGSKVRNHIESLNWTGILQTISIVALVLFMGLRMGANDEVVRNLKSIGIYAFIVTIFVVGFSVLAVHITVKLLGFDKFGDLKKDEKDEKDTTVEDYSGNKKESGCIFDALTITILASVIVGMLGGRFIIFKYFDVVFFDMIAGKIITTGLCLLLLLVGLDLGIEGTVIQSMKDAGIKVILIPIATIIGTIIGSIIVSFIIPISLKESLAVGCGFGWYTLAPGIIMDNGYVVASAIAFMHNMMRELFSIILIPLVAKKIGYIETNAMPGAATMDICLPIIKKSTKGDMVVFAFITGVVLSIAVTVLVPIFIAL